MIIYWSMLLWVPFVYIIYRAAYRKNKITPENINIDSQKNEVFPLLFAVIVFAYFTFWIGMRGNVMDTGQYIYKFSNIPNSFSEAWAEIDWEGKAPGWDIFNAFFKCFVSKDYTWWLMTVAVISVISIMIPLRKYSCDFFFSSFIFIF